MHLLEYGRLRTVKSLIHSFYTLPKPFSKFLIYFEHQKSIQSRALLYKQFKIEILKKSWQLLSIFFNSDPNLKFYPPSILSRKLTGPTKEFQIVQYVFPFVSSHGSNVLLGWAFQIKRPNKACHALHFSLTSPVMHCISA